MDRPLSRDGHGVQRPDVTSGASGWGDCLGKLCNDQGGSISRGQILLSPPHILGSIVLQLQ